jgi:nitrile hydratase
MAHDHHDHDDGHGSPLTETQLRVRALESLLTEKGLVDPRALDELIDTYETSTAEVRYLARGASG